MTSNPNHQQPLPLSVDAAGLKLRLWQHSHDLPTSFFHVLFLHGYYDTGRSFDSLISHLNPHITAWCLDFRGHGQSDKAPPGGSYHLIDHVKDAFYVAEFLEKQKGPVDLLVGHSMGANIALMLAGAVPNKVKGMMLLDGLGAPSEAADEQPSRLGMALQTMRSEHKAHFCKSMEEAIEKLQTNNPNLTKIGASRMAAHMLYPDPNNPERLLFAFDARMKGPTPYRYQEETWRAFCARVQGETWILRAENGYVPPDGEYMARVHAFKNARLFEINNVGHHLHVEVPEVIAQYINQYASEHA